MSLRKALIAHGRDWLASLLCFSFLLIPVAGCPQTGSDLPGVGGGKDETLTKTSSGFFINEDESGNLLVAGRNEAGDAFFVYGTRNANGDIGEIDSITLRGAGGQDAFLAFASGRPVHAQAPDGSYAHVNYTQVTSTRLVGIVDVFNAGDGSVTPVPFDIDLQEAIDDVVAQVQDAIGVNVSVVEVVGASQVETRKASTHQVRITIFPLYTAFVIPCAALIYTTTIILGQLIVALVATLVIAVQNIIIAIFTPFFLLAEIMSDVVVRVRVTPIITIFDLIPDPPVVVLVD